MKLLNQRNPKWSQVLIGKSQATLGDFGCTITCLSMLSEWYGKFKSPDWIAKNLEFTHDGKIFWKSIDGKLPFKFVYRYYKQDDTKIKEILFSKNGSCLLNVNDGKHWVLLVGYSKIFGYRVADPFYGDMIYLKKRYKNITGFTELTA